MKPGHRTTEFWVTVLAIAGGVAAAIATAPVAGPIVLAATAISSGCAAGAYALSRGRVKAAVAEAGRRDAAGPKGP